MIPVDIDCFKIEKFYAFCWGKKAIRIEILDDFRFIPREISNITVCAELSYIHVIS